MKKFDKSIFHKPLVSLVLAAFSMTSLPGVSYAQAQTGEFNLPQTQSLQQNAAPVIISGMTIHPENPLKFDFFVDVGSKDSTQVQPATLKSESQKIINYFFAALTVPEEQMWVNLSPYEKNRIIADGLSVTEMGRDMLEQDYILKQLSASFLNPQEVIGKKFWDTVYKRAQEQYGTTQIPVNTFNKVWIVPENASVYVNGNNVFVTNSHLKVMLESDYLAGSKNATTLSSPKVSVGDLEHANPGPPIKTFGGDKHDVNAIGSEIIRDLILPELEKAVNEGKEFATLRQIYNSMILATWFKRELQKSVGAGLAPASKGRPQGTPLQNYLNANKTNGIEIDDKSAKEKIYAQYIKAYKKGAFIKEDIDLQTQQVIPRRYFSGGLEGVKKVDNLSAPPAMWLGQQDSRDFAVVSVDADVMSAKSQTRSDKAMGIRRLPEFQPVKFSFGSKASLYRAIDQITPPIVQMAIDNGLKFNDEQERKDFENNFWDVLRYLVENLAQHEFDLAQYRPNMDWPFMRMYVTNKPNRGLRVEFWGSGHETLPDLLTRKQWFSYDDRPWKGDQAPILPGLNQGNRIAVSAMMDDLGRLFKNEAKRKALVGWRAARSNEGPGKGNIVSLHIPLGSDQAMQAPVFEKTNAGVSPKLQKQLDWIKDHFAKDKDVEALSKFIGRFIKDGDRDGLRIRYTYSRENVLLILHALQNAWKGNPAYASDSFEEFLVRQIADSNILGEVFLRNTEILVSFNNPMVLAMMVDEIVDHMWFFGTNHPKELIAEKMIYSDAYALQKLVPAVVQVYLKELKGRTLAAPQDQVSIRQYFIWTMAKALDPEIYFEPKDREVLMKKLAQQNSKEDLVRLYREIINLKLDIKAGVKILNSQGSSVGQGVKRVKVLRFRITDRAAYDQRLQADIEYLRSDYAMKSSAGETSMRVPRVLTLKSQHDVDRQDEDPMYLNPLQFITQRELKEMLDMSSLPLLDIQEVMRYPYRTPGYSIAFIGSSDQLDFVKEDFRRDIRSRKTMTKKITMYQIGIGEDFLETEEILRALSEAFQLEHVTEEEQGQWNVNFIAVDVNQDFVQRFSKDFKFNAAYQLNLQIVRADAWDQEALTELGDMYKGDYIFHRNATYLNSATSDGIFHKKFEDPQQEKERWRRIINGYVSIRNLLKHLSVAGTRYVMEMPIHNFENRLLHLPGTNIERVSHYTSQDRSDRTWDLSTGIYITEDPLALERVGLRGLFLINGADRAMETKVTSEFVMNIFNSAPALVASNGKRYRLSAKDYVEGKVGIFVVDEESGKESVHPILQVRVNNGQINFVDIKLKYVNIDGRQTTLSIGPKVLAIGLKALPVGTRILTQLRNEPSLQHLAQKYSIDSQGNIRRIKDGKLVVEDKQNASEDTLSLEEVFFNTPMGRLQGTKYGFGGFKMFESDPEKDPKVLSGLAVFKALLKETREAEYFSDEVGLPFFYYEIIKLRNPDQVMEAAKDLDETQKNKSIGRVLDLLRDMTNEGGSVFNNFDDRTLGIILDQIGFKIIPGSHVLEIGAGNGIVTRGLIELTKDVKDVQFTATDINPEAVQRARQNLREYSNVKVLGGDLFSAVPESEKYDYIIWLPPWKSNVNRDLKVTTKELATIDPQHAKLQEFLKAAPAYLSAKGRIYLVLPRFAGERVPKFLRRFTNELNLEVKELASHEVRRRKSTKQFFASLYELKPASSSKLDQAMKTAVGALKIVEIKRKGGIGGQEINNDKDIERIVEEPWQEAVKALMHKGIKTNYSSANLVNLPDGGILSLVGYTVNDDNRRILKEISKDLESKGEGVIRFLESGPIHIVLYFNNQTTVEEFSKRSLQVINQLKDQAMSSQKAPGGIDFNAKDLKISQEGQRDNVKFNFAQLDGAVTEDMKGIVPIIINITPIPSIYPFLGSAAKKEKQLS